MRKKENCQAGRRIEIWGRGDRNDVLWSRGTWVSIPSFPRLARDSRSIEVDQRRTRRVLPSENKVR